MPNDPIRIIGLNEDGAHIARVTDDGEIWMTETERENDVSVIYVESAIATTKYIVLVDKNGSQFPHVIQGESTRRIDVSAMHIVLDAAINTNGIYKLGVVTRINGVNADIRYFIDVPFLATTTQLVLLFRYTPSQVKNDIISGVTQHFLTNSVETDVAAVNTSTQLDSPLGASTVYPAVGDMVAKLEHVSGGAFNLYSFMFYHSH